MHWTWSGPPTSDLKQTANIQKTQQIVERYLFRPGVTILARSDKAIRPVKIEEIKITMLQPGFEAASCYHDDLPHRSKLAAMITSEVYGDVEEVLQTYRTQHKIFIRMMDLVCVHGWGDDECDERMYLDLAVDRKDNTDGAIEQTLADDAAAVLRRHDIANVACMIRVDTSWPYWD